MKYFILNIVISVQVSRNNYGLFFVVIIVLEIFNLSLTHMPFPTELLHVMFCVVIVKINQ